MGTLRGSSQTARSWSVIASLFLCTAALMGTSIYGFVLLADAMARAHGWSETAAGGLVSAMWLIAPLALISGPVITRVGAWRLIVFGLFLLALSFAMLAVATEFWQVYLIRVVMGVGKVAIMTSMPVAVANWFDARFGTAISIVWAGGSAGGIAVAPMVEFLNRTAGVQESALALAMGIAAVGLLAALTARLRPPSAITSTETTRLAVSASDKEKGAEGRLGPLLITSVITATVGLGCSNVAMIALMPQLFSSFGFGSQTIALVVGANAAAAMIGSLAIGALMDRFGLGWPAMAVGAMSIIGWGVLLLLVGNPLVPPGFVGAFLVGLGGGAAEVLWISLLKREASGPRFSTAYGAWYFALQAGYACGGLVGGWSITKLGSAGYVLITLAAFALTPAFSAWRSLHWSKRSHMPRGSATAPQV